MPFVGVPMPVSSENNSNTSMPFAGVPQPVSGKAEPSAEEAPQPVPEAAEPTAEEVRQPAPEAAGPTAEEVRQPAPETAEPTAEEVRQPAPEAAEQTADKAPQPAPEAAKQEAVKPTFGGYEEPPFENVSPEGGKAVSFAALFRNKLFWICAGAFLLVVLLIVIIANVAAGSFKSSKKGSYFFTVSDGEGIMLYNGTAVKGTDLSYFPSRLGESSDGTKTLYADNSELVLFDGGKSYSVTDELYNSKAKLSDSGAVVYISDGSLYIYPGAGSKSREIAELDDQSKCDFAISPDGGMVVFSEYKIEDGSRKYKYLNAWNGKKVIELDDKFAPYYVSNGGKLICGVDINSKFTYLKNMKPGSSEKLKVCSSIYPVSDDHSKIMYVSDGNTYYFDAGLSDSIKVSSRSFSILKPSGSGSYPKNLNSFYATSNGGIYHYVRTKDSYDSEKIASSASNVILSADGRTIIYRHNDEIIRIPVSNPDKETTVAEDVNEFSAFRCDPTLKHVYFIDDDGELRYAAKKSKKIGSDVTSFVVNDKGLCVYLTDDETLFYSSRGGNKVKITGVSDVISLGMLDNIFYVLTDDALYVSTDGKSFKKSVDR